ncbi:MAG: hypothetical protein U1F48_17980 [Burkholderiales bacterium]
MDFIQLVTWVVPIVVVVAAFFWWRARQERARLEAIRRAQETVSEDEAFLDSSHISGPIPGLTDRAGDPAARAAAAMRQADPPAK